MDQTVTISFNPLYVITWVIVGLIAGLAATWLMRGRVSILSSVIVGLVGALIGGFVFALINIQVGPPLDTVFPIRLIDIIVAFIGALLVLFVFDRILRGR